LLDIVVRDFDATEAIFNREHQLNAVNQVGSEVVRKVRFACDKLNVDAEPLRNERADIADRKTFSLRRLRLKRCQATDCHDEAPDSSRARNILEVDAPRSVTLNEKFRSVAFGAH